jgi:hypothetical protein
MMILVVGTVDCVIFWGYSLVMQPMYNRKNINDPRAFDCDYSLLGVLFFGEYCGEKVTFKEVISPLDFYFLFPCVIDV